MTLFMAFRWLLFILGCILLLYGGAAWAAFPYAAILSLGLSILLFGMVLSDRAALNIARFLAWLITLGSGKD